MGNAEPATEAVEVSAGTFLRKYRVDADLSLRKVAEAAGYAPSHLSRVENGLKKPSHTMVTKVANAIGELLAASRGAA